MTLTKKLFAALLATIAILPMVLNAQINREFDYQRLFIDQLQDMNYESKAVFTKGLTPEEYVSAYVEYHPGDPGRRILHLIKYDALLQHMTDQGLSPEFVHCESWYNPSKSLYLGQIIPVHEIQPFEQGYVICGTQKLINRMGNYETKHEGFVIRINEVLQGTEYTVIRPTDNDIYVNSVAEIENNNIVICGREVFSNGDVRGFIAELDYFGNEISRIHSQDECDYVKIRTIGNDYIAMAKKMDQNGNALIKFTKRIGGVISNYDYSYPDFNIEPSSFMIRNDLIYLTGSCTFPELPHLFISAIDLLSMNSIWFNAYFFAPGEIRQSEWATDIYVTDVEEIHVCGQGKMSTNIMHSFILSADRSGLGPNLRLFIPGDRHYKLDNITDNFGNSEIISVGITQNNLNLEDGVILIKSEDHMEDHCSEVYEPEVTQFDLLQANDNNYNNVPSFYCISENGLYDVLWQQIDLCPGGAQEFFDVYEESNNSICSISPNPASDAIQVEFSTADNDIVDLSITDIYGNTVINNLSRAEYAAGKQIVTIRTSALSTGTYFVVLKSNRGMFSRKFTVVR